MIKRLLCRDVECELVSQLRHADPEQHQEVYENVVRSIQDGFSTMSRLEMLKCLRDLSDDVLVDVSYYKPFWSCFRRAVRHSFGEKYPIPKFRKAIQAWKDTPSRFSNEEKRLLKQYVIRLFQQIRCHDDAHDQFVSVTFVQDMYDVWRDQWAPECITEWVLSKTTKGITMSSTIDWLTRSNYVFRSGRKFDLVCEREVEQFQSILDLQHLVL